MFLNVKTEPWLLSSFSYLFQRSSLSFQDKAKWKRTNFLSYESLLFDLCCIPYRLELGKDTLHSVLMRGVVLGQFSVNIYLPQ